MALLTPVVIPQTGIEQSASAVAAEVGGDSIVASSGVFIQVFNGDASPHTVTIAKPKVSTPCPPYGDLLIEDIVITVPATSDKSFVIPLGYKTSSNNIVWTYDDVTSVTVAAFSLG